MAQAETTPVANEPGKQLGDTSLKTSPSPQAEKAPEKISPQVLAMIRREKRATEIERRNKESETSLQAKLSSFAEREARLEKFEALKKTNPMEALDLLGLSYQDLTQIALADGNVTPDVQVKQMDERLTQFIKSQEMAAQIQTEAQQKQAQAEMTKTTDTFKKEISKYLKDHSDRYELIQFEQDEASVFDVVEEHYERTRKEKVASSGDPTAVGEVLSIADAADRVEGFHEQNSEKRAGLKKTQAIYQRAYNQAKQDLQKQTANPFQVPGYLRTPQPPAQKTLTNQLSATPSPSRGAPLTDEERKAKAIAYARGLRP